MKTRVFFLFLVLLLSAITSSKAIGQNQEKDQITKIVLLGTGTPAADPDRSGPCIAIVVNNTPYLVDIGPGVVRRASAAHKVGINGLAVSNLKHAFVTHLHSDHTVGYPDLIFSSWVLGRDEPLKAYGPKGIGDMTEHILAAYQQDIHMRIYGLEKANKQGYKVEAHEIEPGIVYKDSNVTVEAFQVNHGSWPQAFGYKFTTPDKKIVISGDTAPCESIVEMSMGCDVLIHEVYSQQGFERLSPDSQKYHSSFHTSSYELAEIATKTKPKLLILYHQLFFEWSTEDELLAEIRKKYSGNVVSGKDLEIY